MKQNKILVKDIVTLEGFPYNLKDLRIISDEGPIEVKHVLKINPPKVYFIFLEGEMKNCMGTFSMGHDYTNVLNAEIYQKEI